MRASSACRSRPFVNVNRNAGWDFGGKVQPERRMVNDMRGHIGELLAKAIDRHALDARVPKDELATIRAVPRAYARARRRRALYADWPVGLCRADGGGYAQAPVSRCRRSPFKELLPSRRGRPCPTCSSTSVDMQATMLQPVGGMDRIAHAIYEQVKPAVRLQCAGHRDPPRRRPRADRAWPDGATEADYCICTLPLPASSRGSRAISRRRRRPRCKDVRLSAQRQGGVRGAALLGEDDDIYGGLAWTDRPNENVIYPSDGFNDRQGRAGRRLCAGWTNRDNPEPFARLSHEERFRISRESVEALHPGKSHLLTRA